MCQETYNWYKIYGWFLPEAAYYNKYEHNHKETEHCSN